MGWYIFWFVVTVTVNTIVCWWFWKSSDAERAALKAKIQRLEDEVSNKFKSS